MIGILPRPLASSLYRNLITTRVWARARERMGYRSLPSTELMPLIFGRPYVDVRASFNSFLPCGLDAVTSEILVNAWLERLETHPQFHDKIEFDIAQTILDFSFDAAFDERYPDLLTARRRGDFREALRRLTAGCLDLSHAGTLAAALDAVAELRGRQAVRPPVTAAERGRLNDLAPLLAECRAYGTLPFSILARHAFIAESLLRSATAVGALEPARVRAFKATVSTVSGELSRPVAGGLRHEVNSFHARGMGADDLARALSPLAFAPDGTVEAFTDPDGLLCGVMWHPERERTPAELDVLLLRECFGKKEPEAGTGREKPE